MPTVKTPAAEPTAIPAVVAAVGVGSTSMLTIAASLVDVAVGDESLFAGDRVVATVTDEPVAFAWAKRVPVGVTVVKTPALSDEH